MAKKEPESLLEDLQTEWKDIYQNLLPEAARSHSSAQPRWPVSLDHCFARIILDHTVGINTPWTSKIESPAYKNMSAEELQASVSLGRKILNGKADLVDLDNRSLDLRGKSKKVAGGRQLKRKREDGEETKAVINEGSKITKSHSPTSPAQNATPDGPSPYFNTKATRPKSSATKPSHTNSQKEDLTPYLKKIALSQKPPFAKKVLSLLCQVPRGRYTTYGAIAKHLSSSPRAVGSAIRSNPFAPQVPCHRVLASGGGIGGFHGSWGRGREKGVNDEWKRELLRGEGVGFDGGGMVVGGVWEGFV